MAASRPGGFTARVALACTATWQIQATAARGTRKSPADCAAIAFNRKTAIATAIAAPSIGGCLPQHFLVDDVVLDRLAVDDRDDVPHRLDPHAVDRFLGDAGDVRGGDE